MSSPATADGAGTDIAVGAGTDIAVGAGMDIVVGAGTVLIVGAGLAGLVAAHALGDAGRSAVLVDKGRSPGGRLATRRLAGARLDHGAQFFTVRSPDFAEIVHDWRRAGLVREWCRGFTPEGDGYPRYVIEGGMNTAAKYLASSLEVHCNVNIASIAADARSGITVATTGGTTWHVDAAIVTAPVPQALALLDAGATAIDRQRRSLLDSVEYVPCFALMVVLDGPSAIPFPGGVQDGDPLFSFIGDNMAKGVSDLAAVTFHTNAEYALARFDDDPATVQRELLAEARRWIGSSGVVESQLKRWRYARPTSSHPDLCVEVVPGLVLAGDGFGVSKVEGAALSGLAAAAAVIGTSQLDV